MARPKQMNFFKTAGTTWTDTFTISFPSSTPNLNDSEYDFEIIVDSDWHPETPELHIKLKPVNAQLFVDTVATNKVVLAYDIPLEMYIPGKSRTIRINLLIDGKVYPVLRGMFEVGP